MRWASWGQTLTALLCTHEGRLVRASECVYLLIRVEGIDVLDGRGEQLRREFRRHPDWQRHPALQRGVRRGAVVVHIVVVADLKCRNAVEESTSIWERLPKFINE